MVLAQLNCTIPLALDELSIDPFACCGGGGTALGESFDGVSDGTIVFGTMVIGTLVAGVAVRGAFVTGAVVLGGSVVAGAFVAGAFVGGALVGGASVGGFGGFLHASTVHYYSAAFHFMSYRNLYLWHICHWTSERFELFLNEVRQ